MTTIYCSNKLKDYFGKHVEFTTDDTEPCAIGDWNAHIFPAGGIKFIVFVNNKSLIHFYIQIEKKAELKFIEPMFLEQYFKVMFLNEIAKEDYEIKSFTNTIAPIRFKKTNNDRRTAGVINHYIENFLYYFNSPDRAFNSDTLAEFNYISNDYYMKEKDSSRHFYILERMKELFDESLKNTPQNIYNYH